MESLMKALAAPDQQELQALSTLIVCAESSLRQSLAQKVEELRSPLVMTSSLKEAKEVLIGDSFDVVLCAERACDGTGMELLQWRESSDLEFAVILIFQSASRDEARAAFRAGAAELLLWPSESSQLNESLLKVQKSKLVRQRQRSFIQDMRDSQESFHAIVEQNVDGIFILDEDGQIPFMNQAAARFLGWHQSRPSTRLRDKALELGTTIQIHRINGEKGLGELTWTSTNWQGKPALLVHLRDITERAHTQLQLQKKKQELEQLNGQMSQIEERERRRLASMLHDHVAQNLALANIQLGTLIGTLEDEEQETALKIRKVVRQTIQELRHFVIELSPPILYELGLNDAIQWYCEFLESQFPIRCQYHVRGEPIRLDPALEIVLFQALRELLWNVIKHSQSTEAIVHLQIEPRFVELETRDNGVGFTLDKSPGPGQGSGRFGLFSIQQRLKAHDGQFTIDSSPGHGTRVLLRVPLKK